jgi:uncharacterized membrane protein
MMRGEGGLAGLMNEPAGGGPAGGRLLGLDRLRGLVVVLMALDHARHFLEPAELSPEDLATTTPAYFLSRWLTHLCAPAFVFLAGSGAALQRRSEGLPGRLALRGLWLIALELSWVNFSWSFGFSTGYLGVLWAIGGAMLLLAAVCRLPRAAVGALGALAPALGLLLSPEGWPLGLRLLIAPVSFTVGELPVVVSYTILPWFGVMAMGWGSLPLQLDPRLRAAAGAAALVGFVALRAAGLGDPRPWTPAHPEAWRAAADFFDPSKYPPSLAYQALFLGIGLLLISPLQRLPAVLAAPLDVFGRVPLFFYLLHLPIYHLMDMLVSLQLYGTTTVPPDSPPALGWMVAVWAVGLALLFGPSRAWGAFKARHPGAWWTAYV